MNKVIELKPCPCCGNAAMLEHQENILEVDYFIECQGGCDLTTKLHDSKEEAIIAWNTRTIEAQLQAENERLREALEVAQEFLINNETYHSKKVKAVIKAALQHNEEK